MLYKGSIYFNSNYVKQLLHKGIHKEYIFNEILIIDQPSCTQFNCEVWYETSIFYGIRGNFISNTYTTSITCNISSLTPVVSRIMAWKSGIKFCSYIYIYAPPTFGLILAEKSAYYMLDLTLCPKKRSLCEQMQTINKYSKNRKIWIMKSISWWTDKYQYIGF